ncbi:golgin subfamily A member 6-like protein 22 [Impatiens glandulifera]|uniref:golgin subfamily A member 6-like protein 22 n=1 Tax=Impatiens glandulifera TaxID=253017 RepID=UPI001FB075B1|nr:golgin subfamily A member 6-like protein 22 [Impatiens glandulifera]
MSLTNAETPSQAMDRCGIVRPRARLQKLTIRIRKLKERYVEGTQKANLQLLVLEKLEMAKGVFAEEIDRLEAVFRQREKPHSPIPETSNGQNRSETPPLADPAIHETEERTGTPLDEQLETEQPGVSEPGVTEERVKILIQEFADSTVHPLETKVKKALRRTLMLAENTRDNLVKEQDRITKIKADYRDNTIVRNEHLQQTKALDDKTSKIVEDLDRLERETEQGFTEVEEDLGWSVTDLENKNASLEDHNEKLEANLKALTEQVNELIKAKVNADIAVEEANARAVEEANARAAKEVQDALDEEMRRAKEALRLSEEEIAERERNLMAKNPAFARSIAAQAREDEERLNNERQRLEEFATAHKKKKAASSSSVPAKRKRKISKKAQVAGLLERITETNVDTPPDPPQSEDEDEEHLAERSTRQRVLQAVPISTVGQPQAEGSSSRPDQPKKKIPTKDMMDGFRFSDSE